MANLSKREKFLLFLMGLILPIALLVVLLILPLQNEIEANREQLSLLEIQKTDIETKITLIPTFRAKKEERLEQVNDQFDQIATPLHAAEFERWMLPLFSRYGVPVSTANLSETQVAQPDLMVINVDDPMYRILELINDYNEVVVEESTMPVSTTQLLKATYTYNFNTTFAKYVALLDEIKSWNTTFVVSDSVFNTSENSGSITVSVYSVDKLSGNETLDIYKGDAGLHPNESVNPNQPSDPNDDPYVPEIPK